MRAKRFYKIYQEQLQEKGFTDAAYALYLALIRELGERLPKHAITEGDLNGMVESYNEKWNYCSRRDDRLRPDGFRVLCKIKLRPVIEAARKAEAEARKKVRGAMNN